MNLIKLLFPGKPPSVAPQEAPSTVGAEQILDALSPFSLAQSELDHLCTVITRRDELQKLVSSLAAMRRAEFETKLNTLADGWKPGQKYTLLACQALVGDVSIHPVFEPAAGLINACGDLTGTITRLLRPGGKAFSYTISLDTSQNLMVKKTNNSGKGTSENTQTLPWDEIIASGERDFWIRFARSMTATYLKGATPSCSAVRCTGDAGVFTTFASRLASSQTEPSSKT